MGRDDPQCDLGEKLPLRRIKRILFAVFPFRATEALRSAFLGLLFLAPTAHADWLSLCTVGDAEAGRADYLSHATRPDQRIDRFALTRESPHAASCQLREVPFGKYDVLWARTLTLDSTVSTSTHLALQGRMRAEKFKVSELIVPEPEATTGPARRNIAVPGTNLLPTLLESVFGDDDRAKVERSAGDLILRCAAGTRPAGVVLHSPSVLPTQADLQFRLQAEVRGSFQLGLSDQARTERGDPLPLATLSGGRSDDGWYHAPLPKDARVLADWHSLTLACPQQAAELRLKTLRLNAAHLPARPLVRASWFWSSKDWESTPADIFAQQSRWKLNRIYIGIDVSDGALKAAGELQRFLAEAHRRGLSVWAVFGEPEAIYPAGRLLYQRYMTAVGRFNREAAAASRLDGIQLDIEPYLDTGFGGGIDTWKPHYLDAIAAIVSVSELPVELVVPFWIRDDADFLERLTPWVAGLVIMDYRTDPASIADRAVPFLEWGSARGKPVTVALETIKFPVEHRRYYGQAELGELVAIRLGQRTLLALLKTPVTVPGATSYQWRSTREVVAGQVSFAGHEEDLQKLLPVLETELNAWDGFAGIAIHGLDQFH